MASASILRTATLVVVVGLGWVTLSGYATKTDQTAREADEWEFASEPDVVVGSEDSDPDAFLHLVRAAARFSDGRIVVANGGLESRLPVFAPDGSYLTSIGRVGQGPGEFNWITSLDVGPNDSLYVFDGSLQRLTVFLEDGRQTRTATFIGIDSLAGTTFSSVTRMANGVGWVGRGAPQAAPGPPSVIVRDTIPIGLLDASLTGFRLLTRLPDRMLTTTLVAGRRGFRAPAFSPEAVYAVAGRCVFMSQADSPTISVYDAAGGLVTTFTGPGTLRPVTEEHIASRSDALFLSAPEHEKPLVRRVLRDETKTEHLPFYHAMVVDEWGQLWLQEYSPPWGPGQRWYVVSQSGELQGEVLMPKAMTVFAITTDGVFGRSFGELGEEFVEMFPLTRRPSTMADPLPRCAL